jgi:hypothetical protein
MGATPDEILFDSHSNNEKYLFTFLKRYFPRLPMEMLSTYFKDCKRKTILRTKSTYAHYLRHVHLNTKGLFARITSIEIRNFYLRQDCIDRITTLSLSGCHATKIRKLQMIDPAKHLLLIGYQHLLPY